MNFFPPAPVGALLLCAWLVGSAVRADPTPNVLWIVVDDMSANFASNGETLIRTPNVDRLAREGTQFDHAFVTVPVCSPCRSAFITGMYQTSIGAHHHRSGRGELKIELPAGVVPIPELFQQAGYFTCIGSGLPGISPNGKPTNRDRLGKTDYNFEWDAGMYDSHDWAGRNDGQPFFMQVHLPGGKLRGGTDRSAIELSRRAEQELGGSVDPESVTLPPYYPRDPVLLRDWAAYLDSVRFTDDYVGKLIERLEREGLLDQTLVIFMTDHGISHARGKQFLYDEGTHVPFVVRGPGIPAGVRRGDLIEHIDMAAISLSAAGIAIPGRLHAQDVFAADYQPRDAVFSARDRCDETVDRIRSVRTDEYLYIRNFFPGRPLLQPNVYKDSKSILQALRGLHASGRLDAVAERVLFRETRPAEELYRWTEDRWQVTDLAADPSLRPTLTALRERLDRWILETGDQGEESEAMYDSDMAAYLGGRAGERESLTKRNIELMKRWAAEGK
ncbi:MAG: DUF229 domain-containing protein [Planctomycetaceae bacterium]|nr:MAG: DUF229 domain-containing protein [Planctomycetaceae bacterium]